MRKTQALGKALSIYLGAQRAEGEMHSDVEAFGAPSECHALVAKGEPARLRLARRHAEAVAGMPLRRIIARTKRMLGDSHTDRLWDRLTASRHPADMPPPRPNKAQRIAAAQAQAKRAARPADCELCAHDCAEQPQGCAAFLGAPEGRAMP